MITCGVTEAPLTISPLLCRPHSLTRLLPAQDMSALVMLPHRPNLVLGSSGSGSLAVWDTRTRQCLLATHTSQVRGQEGMTAHTLTHPHFLFLSLSPSCLAITN